MTSFCTDDRMKNIGAFIWAAAIAAKRLWLSDRPGYAPRYLGMTLALASGALTASATRSSIVRYITCLFTLHSAIRTSRMTMLTDHNQLLFACSSLTLPVIRRRYKSINHYLSDQTFCALHIPYLGWEKRQGRGK